MFEESGLERVDLPSTLKRIEYGTFERCKSLKSVLLPKQLGSIGMYSFAESGLRDVTLPDSVRTISQGAFFGCKDLKKAILNDGLEVLGSEEHSSGNKILDGAFQDSALEDI